MQSLLIFQEGSNPLNSADDSWILKHQVLASLRSSVMRFQVRVSMRSKPFH